MYARLDEIDSEGRGFFIAKSETIGATDEEIAGFADRGPVPTDRQQAIFFNLGSALNQLLRAEPAGHA